MLEDKKNEYFLTGKSGTIGKHFSSHGQATNFDITNQREVLKWFQEHDAGDKSFIHLAAIVGDSKVKENFENSKKVNVEGAESVAKIALDSGVDQFFFISTSHVYRPQNERIKEESEIQPQNDYAKLKREAEERIIEVFKGSSSKLVILRVFSVLDFYTSDFTLGGKVTHAIQDRKQFHIESALDERDFLTPKHVAQAIEFLISNRIPGGIYNLCSGVSKTVKEAVQEMLIKATFPVDWAKFDDSYSNAPKVCGSNFKLLKLMPELKPLLRWELSEYERSL
jgi:nucleoside-diphosphate-sugar epimerase